MLEVCRPSNGFSWAGVSMFRMQYLMGIYDFKSRFLPSTVYPFAHKAAKLFKPRASSQTTPEHCTQEKSRSEKLCKYQRPASKPYPSQEKSGLCQPNQGHSETIMCWQRLNVCKFD
jgi:hypothetical protein